MGYHHKHLGEQDFEAFIFDFLQLLYTTKSSQPPALDSITMDSLLIDLLSQVLEGF